MYYTNKDRERAMQVSLTALATSMGYTPIRQGSHYTLKEMDSVVIYNDRSWYRWSGKGTRSSGSQIDFLLEFGNVQSVPEAIHQLLEFDGYKEEYYLERNESVSEQKKTSLNLPPHNSNYRRLYAYLIQTRGLSQKIVSKFVQDKLIYEDAVHHNIVYCGYDPDGNIRYAGMRGTADIYGKKFKMDVPGNDKNYGVNLVNKASSELKVFESVIDCMSYMDIYNDYESNKLILGMVEDNPLIRFVKDYKHIKSISFCLDNDEAGQKAIYGDINTARTGLKEKYEKQGYLVKVEVPPAGKDFNESLIELKKNRSGMKQQIVKLTGLPVSENMKIVLNKLKDGKNVTLAEINNTEEIKMARSNILHSTPTIQLENRIDIQAKVFSDMRAMGAAGIDESGRIVYTCKVKKGSRLDIVIGLPASGKSSAIVNNLSSEFHSRIIDNDDAKKLIPQYNNGWGAGIVHDESQYISDSVFYESICEKENIILPKVGSNPEKLIEHYIKPAKQLGYQVNVHFVDLDRNKALGRMLNRFIEEGRFLEPNLIEKYAPLNQKNRIEVAYEYMKTIPFIDGFSKWNNDVARDQAPILLEYHNLDGAFIDNARLEKGDGQNEYAKNITNHLRNDRNIRESGRSNDSVDDQSQRRDGKTVSNGQIENIECDLSEKSVGRRAEHEKCERSVGNVPARRGRGR